MIIDLDKDNRFLENAFGVFHQKKRKIRVARLSPSKSRWYTVARYVDLQAAFKAWEA